MAILRAIDALGRRKNRRTHELHPILRMQFVQFLEFCGVLRIERELRGLVKELLESAQLPLYSQDPAELQKLHELHAKYGMELRGLVKELFESGGLAHKDQLASSR